MLIICGTGKTAAPPNSTIWSWCVRTTIGCTTWVVSPSPGPRTASGSPTTKASNSVRDPWHDHRPQHPRPSPPTADRPANAPNGSGTPPTNHHHQPTTSRAHRRPRLSSPPIGFVRWTAGCWRLAELTAAPLSRRGLRGATSCHAHGSRRQNSTLASKMADPNAFTPSSAATVGHELSLL